MLIVGTGIKSKLFINGHALRVVRVFYAITGTRSLLKAFEAYLDHRGVVFHVESYGHRHSEFERDVALLFHPVHGSFGRGSSR